MVENIDSSNITEISINADFNKAAAKEIHVPTIDEYIKQTIEMLDQKIEKNKAGRPEIAKSFIEQKERFIELTSDSADIPDHLELALVLAHPKPNNYDEVYLEFKSTVRKEYIKTMLSQAKDGLEKRGLSKYVLDLMEYGAILQDIFDTDLHHISERYICGKLSTETDEDPQNPFAEQEHFLVNNFNNLIFVPTKTHHIINELKGAQSGLHPESKPHFLLMLVPKGRDPQNPFMLAPQSNVEKFGIEILSDDEVIDILVPHLHANKAKKILSKDINKGIATAITSYINENLGKKDLSRLAKNKKLIDISHRILEDRKKPQSKPFGEAVSKLQYKYRSL